MRLEDLTIALRPRSTWEAVDLGCVLVRRDYGRILLLWVLSTVPLWALMGLLLREHPGWFGLAVWWLKPLYDRLPLYHLSRAAFGSRPTLKETLREWPRLWSRFLFSALLLRRFSVIRSFALPVWMLEGQKGRAVGSRLKSLATDGGGSGGSLTWVFIKLELAVYCGLYMLLGTIGGPEDFSQFWDWFTDPEGMLEASSGMIWYSNGIYMLAISLLEPFYVGGGFGLYLNSRTKLEGWDVELTFRRLAARLSPAVSMVMAALLAAVWLAFAALPAPVMAQEAGLQESGQSVTSENLEQGAGQESKAEIRNILRDILAEPEFEEHHKTQRVWIPDSVSPKAQEQGSPFWGRLVMIVGIIILLFLLWLAIRWLVRNGHLWKVHRSHKVKAPLPVGPRVVMGLDIASESLPDDILAAARKAWAAGHVREALSLLYRGSLSRLVEQRHLPIRDSDTEDDCLSKVAALEDGSVTDFFRRLTVIWVRAAYAGIEARQAEFEDLCGRWPFTAATGAAGGGRKVFARATVLLLAVSPLLSGCKGRWEDVPMDLGYKGEARIDPFLAARRLLEEMGIPAERSTRWGNLPESYGSVLFASGEGGMSEARAQMLLNWVRGGGHLVYPLTGCTPYNDWNPIAKMVSTGLLTGDDTQDPILREMQVKAVKFRFQEDTHTSSAEEPAKKEPSAAQPEKEQTSEAPKVEKNAKAGSAPKAEEAEKAEASEKKEKKEDPQKETAPQTAEEIKAARDKATSLPTRLMKVTYGEEQFWTDFPETVAMKYDGELEEWEYAAGGEGQSLLLSLEYGLGRVTFVNHAQPFRNRYLDERDHAALLVALAGDAVEARFIVGLQDSFWALLWDKAWQALVGLAVVILFWLWLKMPRFGPMRHVRLHETRRFMEHVRSLGFFFYRLKRPDIVLGAAADAVRTRAWRRHPYLAGLDDTALAEMLSERCDLPPERIRAALDTEGRPAVHDLVRRMQDLQTLRAALE